MLLSRLGQTATAMSTLKLINITDQFPQADGVYHLAYYHPPKAGEQDQISKYLLDFEDGAEPQTTQWIRLAALLVSQSLSFDIVVRPISNNEFDAKKPTPLEKLCIAISRKSGAKYQRNRLQRTTASNVAQMMRTGEVPNDCTDVYSFSDEYATAISRVLVVDDFVVNSATVNSIANAIRAKLPQAKVLFFALGRMREDEANTHLDARYFVSSTSPMPPVASVKPTIGPRVSVNMSEKEPRRRWGVRRDVSALVEGITQQQMLRRAGIGSAMLVLAFGMVLLTGGYMLFANRRPVDPNAFYQVPAYTVSATEAPVVADPVKNAQHSKAAPRPEDSAVDPQLPVGVVTVPSVGLRAESYIDAKVLKTTVKSGERVYIVKKVSSSTGPRWMQIRTKAGKVGWVWASVVRELRSRALAAR